MTRISLLEQYNNKDVVEQIYDIKERLDELEDVDPSTYESRITSLESANILKTGQISVLTGRMTSAESDIVDNKTDIEALEDELVAYQLKSEKNVASGYAGLNGSAKLDNSLLQTGIALNQILQAGAQLLANEVLYVDENGKIRSRAASGSTTYQGRFSSVASLPTSGVSNGDWATVYGASPSTDDGMYVYNTNATPAAWQKGTLFDATDYQLVTNLVTSLTASATDSQYPSAKAVYDHLIDHDVDSMTSTAVSGNNSIGITTIIKNHAGESLAYLVWTIETAPTINSGDYRPAQAGAVYNNLQTKLNASKCTYQTTAPTEAITDGGVHIVYLSSEPTTKYDGYIYLIASSS